MNLNIGKGVGRADGRYQPKADKVEKPFSVEEAQHAIRDVSSTAPIEKTEPTPSVKQTETMVQALKPETLLRPITKEDIVNLLISIKKMPTVENQLIISALLEHGLEASEQNFNAVAKYLKGKGKGNTIRSAVIALTKGLDSLKSVDIISRVLSNSAQFSQQVQQAQTALSNFFTMLQFSKELFNTTLFNSFASIISEMNDELKKLIKKSSKGIINKTSFNRSELVNNLKALHAFLGGIGQKISDPQIQQMPLAKALLEQLQPLKNSLSALMEAVTSQAILSKDSILQTDNKYAYWQFPNPMAKAKEDIELLIQKSTKNNGVIDPDNTKIILKLDTQDLGELNILVKVENKKVAYTFQTDNDATKEHILKSSALLKERMESINYKLVGFHTRRKKLDIKKEIFPTFNLDNISRIRTEV